MGFRAWVEDDHHCLMQDLRYLPMTVTMLVTVCLAFFAQTPQKKQCRMVQIVTNILIAAMYRCYSALEEKPGHRVLRGSPEERGPDQTGLLY